MGCLIRCFFPCLIASLLSACGVDEELELVGTVERTVVELAAPVSEAITRLPLEIGDHVYAGQLVVQLNDEIAHAELAAAKASLQAATATLEAGEREFNRFSGLRNKKATSATRLDEVRRVRDEALALVAERSARVTVAKKRLRDLSVSSPVNGRVDQRPFELGERVPAGVVVAVVLSEYAPWVRVWMPARAVSRINTQRSARIRIDGFTEEFAGQIQDVSHEPEFTPHYALTERESAHLVYRARISIKDAPEALRPGLTARVTLDPME